MGIREELVERFGDDQLLFMDGYDDAILGVCKQCNGETIIAYSYEKVIEVTMRDGSTIEEAIEHFEYKSRKDDKGKTPWHLVNLALLKGIAYIREFGNKKYLLLRG